MGCYWICFIHLESFQDLFRLETLEHEDTIFTLFYLHFQEITECDHRNLTMQLINKHIDLIF